MYTLLLAKSNELWSHSRPHRRNIDYYMVICITKPTRRLQGVCVSIPHIHDLRRRQLYHCTSWPINDTFQTTTQLEPMQEDLKRQ